MSRPAGIRFYQSSDFNNWGARVQLYQGFSTFGTAGTPFDGGGSSDFDPNDASEGLLAWLGQTNERPFTIRSVSFEDGAGGWEHKYYIWEPTTDYVTYDPVGFETDSLRVPGAWAETFVSNSGGLYEATAGTNSHILTGPSSSWAPTLNLSALGTRTAVLGGINNTIPSGTDSTIVSGNTNTSTGSESFIAGGSENTNTGVVRGFIGTGSGCSFTNTSTSDEGCFIGTGTEHAVDGSFSGVISGNDCDITASYGFIGSGSGIDINCDYSFIGTGVGCNILNTATTDQYAFIGTGSAVETDGSFAAVITGNGCYSKADYSFVGTGYQNRSYAPHSFIGSGANNQIASNSDYNFIGVGNSNQVNNTSTTAKHAFIGNGNGNTTDDDYAVIVNGQNNDAGGGAGIDYTFIGNGSGNSATKLQSTVLNGDTNTVSAQEGIILNGNSNSINDTETTSVRAFIGNGSSNITDGDYATILNGFNNSAGNATVVTDHATISNGNTCTTAQSYSFIANGQGSIIKNTSGTETGFTFIGTGTDVTIDGSYSAIIIGSASDIDNLGVNDVTYGFGGAINTSTIGYTGGGILTSLSAHTTNFYEHAHASGSFSDPGDAQISELVLRGEGRTGAVISLDGGGSEHIKLKNNHTYGIIFRVTVIDTVSPGTNGEFFDYHALLNVDGSGNVTHITGTGAKTTHVLAGSVVYGISLDLSSPNMMVVEGTSTGSNDERWVIYCQLTIVGRT